MPGPARIFKLSTLSVHPGSGVSVGVGVKLGVNVGVSVGAAVGAAVACSVGSTEGVFVAATVTGALAPATGLAVRCAVGEVGVAVEPPGAGNSPVAPGSSTPSSNTARPAAIKTPHNRVRRAPPSTRVEGLADGAACVEASFNERGTSLVIAVTNGEDWTGGVIGGEAGGAAGTAAGCPSSTARRSFAISSAAE